MMDLLNAEQAAAIIGCTANHVGLLCRSGKLAARKFYGRTWAIERRVAEKFAKIPQKTGRPRLRA